MRIYRHECNAFDGVWSLDTCRSPTLGTLAASVGQDGQLLLVRLDEEDLIPYRKRLVAGQLSALLSLMQLTASDDDNNAAANAGASARASADGRLRCTVAMGVSGLASEQTEAAIKGELAVPLRATLTAMRLKVGPPAPMGGQGQGQTLGAVGGFSGLCRIMDLEDIPK